MTMTDMQARGGRNSSYRGGRGNPSYRGRGSNKTIITYGDRRLVAADISGLSKANNTELEEFNKWKELQKRDDIPSISKPSFANIVNNRQDEMMIPNIEERVILLLNENDLKWSKEPWMLYERYLSPYGYTMETYKNRMYYEIILKENGCEINHFTGTNPEIYNFSKIIIKKIISIEDWGISPYREKTISFNGSPVKYNYWDYIQAFDKCFLYENEKRSHTWFIKVSSEIYNFSLPSWFINWWKFYGTTEEILPDIIRDYYDEWQEVKPSQDNMNIPNSMRFFIEFSIPWIWKFSPTTGYTQGVFCLKRKSCSRFWEKMIQEDEQKQLNCASTLNLLIERTTTYKQLQLQEQEKLKEQERAKFLDIMESESTMDIGEASNEDIIKAYMDSLRKALESKKEGDKRSSDDSSMVSNTSKNSFNTLQDSQEPDDTEIIIEDVVLAFLKGKNKE